MENQTVWIVGQCDPNSPEWFFQGVFSTEQQAIDQCIDERFFIGPAIIDEVLPLEILDWEGCYYPNKTKYQVVKIISK